MTSPQSPFSSLNDLSYQLNLLYKEYAEINKKPLPQIREIQDKSEILLQLVENLKTWQLDLYSSQTTLLGKAHLPLILDHLKELIDKIINLTRELQPSSHLPEEKIQNLLQEATRCQATIDATEHSISIETKEQPDFLGQLWQKIGKPTLQQIPKIFGKGASVYLSIQSVEIQKCKDLINDYSQKLIDMGHGPPTVRFAKTISETLVTYLREHVLHIQERDPALRPEFLEYFFDDPYSHSPKPSFLGNLFIPLLKDHEGLAITIVEANMLKALYNAYTQLNEIQNNKPELVLEFARKTLEMGLEHIRSEEEARKTKGIGELKTKERNLILSGAMQKAFAQFILALAFPQGNKEIFIPNLIPSILGKERLVSWIRQTAFSLTTEGLGDLFFLVLADLSEHNDVKEELLIEGYEIALSTLEKPKQPSVEEPRQEQPRASHSLLVVGILASCIKIFIDTFKSFFTRKSSTHTRYEYQERFNTLIYSTAKTILKKSTLSRITPDPILRYVASKIGNALTTSLQSIRFVDVADQVLESIATNLTEHPEIRIYPRTIEQLLEQKQIRQENQRNRRAHLHDLENRFGQNIDGLIDAVWDAMKLPDREISSEERQGIHSIIPRIKRRTKHYINSCLYKAISFICWVGGVKRITRRIGQKTTQTAEAIKQDILLPRISTFMIEELKP